MDYQAPRGTQDILPEEQAYWRYVESKAAKVAARYGYSRIDTPTFEDARLFTRTVGEETDIVTKEMYTFQDRGGSDLTLRPEGTAPVCRAYIEHGMASRTKPVKLYYLASIFRYDRPQAGRYREHHQFGFELFGEADAAADAEVIDMAWSFYRELGITTLPVQLNSIGCPECRAAYLAALKEYYASCVDTLCGDCKIRYGKNPLRLLDCKKPDCRAAALKAPHAIDYLCPDCKAHFEKLTALLGAISVPFEVNHCLVRGLDYYSRTVFEIQPQEEGAQSTIGGGGRYDNLIPQLGGEATPAIGFATGIERIILNLKRQSVTVPALEAPRFFLAALGEAAVMAAFKLASDLRREGIPLVESLSSRSLKSQLRQASGLGARYTLILGEAELESRQIILRDMGTSAQHTLPLDGLSPALKAL
ncbi:histidyl-tRNA synthetase [Dehalogenimonas formicexedens]|uniref:Histidine--tRNA ligase n=1 Tax=Dehalogenimonas formicexedens TaxID=1839801 RepID=A0A1P8F4J5_9CHLR|nr:histidine--tRNA ligase [Dehalogenimonas formicexedens]APV43391.1 histidyl-tRNA synthetase [Dehalogenimonas formicexedens]